MLQLWPNVYSVPYSERTGVRTLGTCSACLRTWRQLWSYVIRWVSISAPGGWPEPIQSYFLHGSSSEWQRLACQTWLLLLELRIMLDLPGALPTLRISQRARSMQAADCMSDNATCELMEPYLCLLCMTSCRGCSPGRNSSIIF